VNPYFLELFGRQRAGLGQNVLGHRQLPDVVSNAAVLMAWISTSERPDRLRQALRVELHAQDVRVGHLILRVDGARQRFDRRQVEVGGSCTCRWASSRPM